MFQRLFVAVFAVLCLAPSGWAQSVDLSFSGKPVYIQSEEVEDERKADNWSGRLGIGLRVAPDFLGASSNNVELALDFKGSYKDLFFIENNKIGSIMYRGRLLRAGIIGRATLGREDDLVLADLQGLPDVGEAFEVGVFAGTSLYKLFLSGEVYFDVSGVHNGVNAELEIGYTHEFNSRFTATPVLGAVWGSKDYQQTYFGVEEGGNSNFASYNAGAGFYELFAEVAMEHRLSKNWLLKGSARISGLTGSAAKSPIVRSDDGSTDQLSAFFAVVWLF